MESHGASLARKHKISMKMAPDQILARLAENEKIISGTCILIAHAVEAKQQIMPAAEWLLDNYYLIEEQIRTAKKHLPRDYSRGLPRLRQGNEIGPPRIYEIAMEIISHGDARIDPESLSRFVNAYQKTSPLRLGELWALPIMLRLALIENLRRISDRLGNNRLNRDLADLWADQMIETAEKDPSSLILVVADMARSQSRMEGAFVAELARRLQGQGSIMALPLSWIEQRLAQSFRTIEQVIQTEVQQQAADQVSVSNSIGSLRLLSTINWRDFVESLSVVEKILRLDPAGVYGRMDFATRDRYRHSVEKIAGDSPLSEEKVASQALAMAQESENDDERTRHIGYYLIDRGAVRLEHAVRMRLPVIKRMKRLAGLVPLQIYLGVIGLISCGLTFALITHAGQEGMNGPLLAWVTILTLIGASQLAVTLVNWLTTMLARPRIMPRLDFSQGITPEARTLAVVPTLLTDVEDIDHLCEALEVRYLANRGPNLYFSLLTDFMDSPGETRPEDGVLLDYASDEIRKLNERYADGDEDIFFLMHRPRLWNPQEKIWMGHERKRGKIGDLNEFLRGGNAAPFSRIEGRIESLKNIKYVITLDTDTQLPRDSARQFAGTMAHPLNRAFYDEQKGRVTEGYGIIQPRVMASLPGANISLYARFCGGEPGIDPYTRAVSDVYQDVFGEGSFIGKGIYDVDAFEKTLKGRMPENRILSHDLLEGCYARAGLLSDVQLYEEYPSRYSADASRRHRWIRGDWQVAGWILPYVPAPGGKRVRNPLSGLSRWKIFDNLRRSLVPPSLLLLLLTGWFLMPSPWLWTAAVAGIFLIPSFCATIFDLVRKPKDTSIRQKLATAIPDAYRHFSHTAFQLAVLPHEAFYHADAIGRVLWRMIVSRRRLLEWTPSSQVSRSADMNMRSTWKRMWFPPVLVIGVILFLIVIRPEAVASSIFLLIPWFLSPALIQWMSRPLPAREPALSPDQIRFLNRLSRRIWAFFETYVGPDDHWLPPDNIQEKPVSVIAHRTSPTNMGLVLLANLSAWDFGYITAGRFIERTAETLKTMSALPRYRGHFYNWYDTETLKPLHPLYVSSVDSGNLAGHLMILRQGLISVIDRPIVAPALYDGLRSTLDLIEELYGHALPEPVLAFRQRLGARLPPGQTETAVFLDELIQLAGKIASNDGEEISFWRGALIGQCQDALKELSLLPPGGWGNEAIIPSLQDIADHEPESTPLAQTVRARIKTIETLAQMAEELSVMDYEFLYDSSNHLLAIGYNVDHQRRDASYYDLLASEARLACFVAVARGQLPQDSWFALGRQLADAGGGPALVSWSGSMFEYLMPLLIMPTFDHTLLDQTYRAIVRRQIEYGAQRGVPWGVSESGYHMFDANLNYQYRAFGVPGLGLKRGLGGDLVIAPYASIMAMMVDPEESCRNLQRMTAQGFSGKFGLYEAIDYTTSRLPRGRDHALIQSFMAHHQGMGFLSLGYFLLNRPMQKRFESDPLFQATALLLHEKVPRTVTLDSGTHELSTMRTGGSSQPAVPIRILDTPNSRTPEVQLLSNGRYHVMISSAGGSYSRWRDLAVTRWREDPTRDHWGMFCYIRDKSDGAFWSTAYQPTLKMPKRYEAVFSESRAEFRRRDGDLDTHTEIVVSPEDDIEIRRSRITNRSRQRKQIDVTSYAEIVMASPAADAAHPAFSNLFVQTEILKSKNAILCTRRPRSIQENPPWMFHTMVVHGGIAGPASFETDRAKFIGRGHTTTAPRALLDSAPLSNSDGSVLDPVAAIRHQITLEPGQSVTVDIVTGVAETRDSCMGLLGKYQDMPLADRVFEMSWTHGQATLRQLNASDADAQLYGRLAGSILYANASLRAEAGTLIKNRRGQSGLWSYAISGDLPIILLKISDIAHIDLARQLVQAHAYWRLKGLSVDLVIWNEDQASYRQVLQEQIMGLIAAGTEAHTIDRPGGIFVRALDQISAEDRILMESVARIVIAGNKGTLEEQIRRPGKEARIARLVPSQNPSAGLIEDEPLSLPPDLVLFNGTGGFTPDGREYVILTGPGRRTPVPWSNILANPYFGSVISESGQSYSWGENAHEFRLTPWHNDPVMDTGGEAFYLRDEDSGIVWSPTALPMQAGAPYITRHGFGYSVFEHQQSGIRSELQIYVAIDASVKFSVLRIKNLSAYSRKISATGYAEWVLGEMKSKTGLHIVTDIDPGSGALIARNEYNTEFSGRVAFFDVDTAQRTFTGDRREFIGRNGSLQQPEALNRTHLSGRTGPGLDACAAIQVLFEMEPGEEQEIIFRMGVTRPGHGDDLSGFIRRFRGTEAARAALDAVHAYWRETLGAVQVETPDKAVNLLANGWLLYQTIACRMWARSGYYQSGGAFGFRDQLQDAMALVHTRPELLRDHLLLCARHQFVEGDVQHWWHPPSDRGVRTKCSDDYLWLPLAVSRYVEATNDTGILEEIVPFIEGRQLHQGEDSYYDLPIQSAEADSLYQHCIRAIMHGLRFGARGLPLIGSCDWNDGMDKVGEHGQGESVWLAFFLYDILLRFADVAARKDDTDFAERCRSEAKQLRQNIEAGAWDGAWYRRAYFDDGTPLGSSANEECQIDSLSQSWAVLSGAGSKERAQQGMESADARLVRRDRRLVQLLDPPFDKSSLNPGYIRGYVPGVRENGGQYTHAAIWTAMAFAELGDRRRTWEILEIINPLNHGRTPKEVALYKAEPYVVAADVYGEPPHTGRGGWTWYTGSAGWMYRLILESLLGLHRHGNKIRFSPCLPPDWTGFKISYRYRETLYEIEVESAGETGIIMDGAVQQDDGIPLLNDGNSHKVQISLGKTGTF